MIGSFASGANVSLVAKNGTKKIIPLLWIKSSKKPQIKKFHKTDPPKVGILIQNTISKFSKTKNQRPPKRPEGLLGAQRAVGGPKGPPAPCRS